MENQEQPQENLNQKPENELTQLLEQFKSKKLIIISSVVAVLIITGGISAYFLWPEVEEPTEEAIIEDLKDETIVEKPADEVLSNWKTYRNEEYGFEMEYPQEWFIESFKEGLVLSNMRPNSEEAVLPGQVLIQVGKEEFIKDSRMPDYVTDFYSYLVWEFSDFALLNGKVEKTKLASLDAYKARFYHEHANLTAYMFDTAFESAEGKYVKIVYNEDVETELVDQIFSTFKFIP